MNVKELERLTGITERDALRIRESMRNTTDIKRIYLFYLRTYGEAPTIAELDLMGYQIETVRLAKERGYTSRKPENYMMERIISGRCGIYVHYPNWDSTEYRYKRYIRIKGIHYTDADRYYQ